jgi:hypothetical protein
MASFQSLLLGSCLGSGAWELGFTPRVIRDGVDGVRVRDDGRDESRL